MEDIVQEAQNADDKAKKAIADVILHLYSKFMLNTCKDHCGKHPNPCLFINNKYSKWLRISRHSHVTK